MENAVCCRLRNLVSARSREKGRTGNGAILPVRCTPQSTAASLWSP